MAEQSSAVVNAAMATMARFSLLALLSGFTTTSIVVILAMCAATPLFVIFSPVLVPAAIIIALVVLCYMATSCCFGLAAKSVLWIYRYMMGKNLLDNVREKLLGKNLLDNVREKLLGKALEMKDDKAEQYAACSEASRDSILV